ncbi:MAG: MiaB/RimO family radical SAM methylthiotransferase [Alphaproteobacteria bacterium]|nr:MiaB/RimO family radical SAM methylthiotransferase [Alphaproteobacteria bacterium]MBP5708051.1 MiaB/RimO family radical SAM methylthiotransferase [Alphaproteobacteria bacterium]
MQEENNKNDIQTITFGCRLNAVESEKIAKMLDNVVPRAVVVNTCAVTGEAERQSAQYVRRVARENPNTPIFITGCAATHDATPFEKIQNVRIIHNTDKMDANAYIRAVTDFDFSTNTPKICVANPDGQMSKQFIQIQNGCNHDCTYCITRLLRGPSVSFEYDDILADVRSAVKNGYGEIVLTGVDSASYHKLYGGKPFLISDLCRKLLADVPEIRRLRLSSMDPASPEIYKIIDLMHENDRMMPHLHLSMQSGSDTILESMRRRHNANMVRDIVARATGITFSWDIICGFPGESDKLFTETLDLVAETRPIKIHAFPFSPRPGTAAATMPNQIQKSVAKQRVKSITNAATHNRKTFMSKHLGQIVSVLVEENNLGRTPHDISVKIMGDDIPNRTICNCKIIGIDGETFVGTIE